MNKYGLLINHLDMDIYELISEETVFDAAFAALEAHYVKPTNITYARHVLATRKQKPGESLDLFAQELRSLAKRCEFTVPESAKAYEEEYITDAFINGMTSNLIRERLLEESRLTLKTAFDLCCFLNC